MPYISTEALLGAGLLVVLAVGYQYIPKATSASSSSSKDKKKNKNKKKGSTTADTPNATVGQPQATKASSGDTTPRPSVGTIGEPPKQQPPRPAAEPAKPKTLAEKIAPKARKTKVDDMLAPEDLPAKHARVMRVVDSSTPKPSPQLSKQTTPKPADQPSSASTASSSASGTSASDRAEAKETLSRFTEEFASSDEETSAGGRTTDDGWNVVAAKPKKPISLSLSQSAASAPTSSALPVSTKIQRKNAKKAEAKKAAKAAEEADRLQRLKMHKKDLERRVRQLERINELYSSSSKKTSTVGGAGRTTAGATLDNNGKLVWD